MAQFLLYLFLNDEQHNSGVMDLTVKYDRAMIDLVREIRRHVHSDLKPSIKLANPDLLYELRDIYRSGNNVIINALIKEMYFKAGPEWMAQLEQEVIEQKEFTVKVYRGHRQLAETAPEQSTSGEKKPKMYRGHPVVD